MSETEKMSDHASMLGRSMTPTHESEREERVEFPLQSGYSLVLPNPHSFWQVWRDGKRVEITWPLGHKSFLNLSEDCPEIRTFAAAMQRPSPAVQKAVEALELIAEERDAGRHDGLPEPCPVHDADIMWAVAREALAALQAEAGQEKAGGSFQARVDPWMQACFGPVISADKIERNHRFLEEALELVQANGCTQSEAHQLVDYVFDRPAGDPAQEAGGVMVTLAALCLATGLDMHAAGETELARVWTKVEQIRAKHAAKPKHSPLPAEPNLALSGFADEWEIGEDGGLKHVHASFGPIPPAETPDNAVGDQAKNT